MGCGVTDEGVSDPELLNFVDQIACGADTFVERYKDAIAVFGNDRRSIFFNRGRGVRHGYDCESNGCKAPEDQGKGPTVTFFVNDRMTWVQYAYTPWILGESTGGGVYLFYNVWSGNRFQFPWRD